VEEWGPDCAGGGEIGCLSILECVVELTARLAEDGQAVAPLFDWLGGWVVGWLGGWRRSWRGRRRHLHATLVCGLIGLLGVGVLMVDVLGAGIIGRVGV